MQFVLCTIRKEMKNHKQKVKLENGGSLQKHTHVSYNEVNLRQISILNKMLATLHIEIILHSMSQQVLYVWQQKPSKNVVGKIWEAALKKNVEWNYILFFFNNVSRSQKPVKSRLILWSCFTTIRMTSWRKHILISSWSYTPCFL